MLHREMGQMVVGSQVGTTDDNGIWHADSLGSKPFDITIEAKGFAPLSVRGVNPSTQRELRLSLKKEGRFLVNVIDGEGARYEALQEKKKRIEESLWALRDSA